MSARPVINDAQGSPNVNVNAQKTSLAVIVAPALAGHSLTVWGDNCVWDNTSSGPVPYESVIYSGVAGTGF